MAKIFDSVKSAAPGRNKFDLSHERKFSFNMGDLIPILCQEVVPGDKFRVNTEVLMRLAPMLAPIMHRVNVKVEYFFVPNRLVWDEWEEFITGGRLGTSAPVVPKMNLVEGVELQTNMFEPGRTLWDYFGLPTLQYAQVTDPTFVDPGVSAIPFRAYQMICTQYYRDQNTTEEGVIPKTSGEQTAAETHSMMQIRRRCWEKDYFTSALPFAQRGPAVEMPLNGLAEVEYKPVSDYMDEDGNPVGGAASFAATADPDTQSILQDGASTPTRVENIERVVLDASGVSINDLRRSIRLQEWLELAARVGGRYVEILKGFFGVRPDDARLQRPEFLGGSSSPVQISEVLSTVQQVADDGELLGTPQGDMSGHGISRGNRNGFSRFFKEHGTVIGIISVLPRTAYQQGINRMWTRHDKFDYYWRQFANIGEQEVRNMELYVPELGGFPAGPTNPFRTFGYQSRYAEYKYGNSTVHGDFKTNLAFWHMGRIFDAPPSLNTSFVESDPTFRIFAVDNNDHKLWCHLHHKFDAVRPMPYYGTPTL